MKNPIEPNNKTIHGFNIENLHVKELIDIVSYCIDSGICKGTASKMNGSYPDVYKLQKKDLLDTFKYC